MGGLFANVQAELLSESPFSHLHAAIIDRCGVPEDRDMQVEDLGLWTWNDLRWTDSLPILTRLSLSCQALVQVSDNEELNPLRHPAAAIGNGRGSRKREYSFRLYSICSVIISG